MDNMSLEIEKSPQDDASKKNIEVWEDLVYIKDLTVSLAICTFTTFAAYFLAPNTPPKPLFFGLSGAILGFVICSFFIKPKRLFIEKIQED
ncbi:hypothetical protein [Clostridium polynesiense]|uniref:hypothetical protein n=1 Tax=Clostridium polynesiense TaxID=1325933 RepID=UPI0009E5082C|nr:hypothetical protein [Clostridium polynesiense]